MSFLEEKRNTGEEEVSQISIERAQRLGKRKEDRKSRPMIQKDKETILSNARKLAITQDFPRETVYIRKAK